MSAAQLMIDLARLEIRIEAHGGRLRYSPRSAVTPDLADRMKAHKGELLAILRGDFVAREIDFDATQLWRATLDRLEGNLLFPPDVMGALRSGEARWVSAGGDEPTTESQCHCGCSEYRDVPIHGGRSVRRDCRACGKFIEFTYWYDAE